MQHLSFPPGHEARDVLDLGWRRDDAAVERMVAGLSHPGPLAAAAPHLMDDIPAGDIQPYLAWYEVECRNDDGEVWKAKGEEPPYIPQTGNNCTSEGLMHCADLLQVMQIASPDPNLDTIPVFHRTAVEATYAFGLAKANMRGDNGCFGGAMAKGAYETGLVTYKTLGAPYQETRSRLVSFASNPAAVVRKYGADAAKAKIAEPVKITTVEEARAWLANTRGLITIASNVGFNTPRDSKGICRRRGRWDHQMALWGYIESDGTPTFVIVQSWGPNQPTGPQPFKLPSLCFRALTEDVQAIFDQGDSWGITFGGYERVSLPSRWVNNGWGL